MQNPIIAALAARVRASGSAPLLTWYRPSDGARTELSGKTFANWVDKTANLLDTLSVEGPITGRLNLDHPGHWMSLIWPLAAWQRGLGYLDELTAETELVVIGPEQPAPTPGVTTIACSLHPLGLGLRGLPDGVLDFTTEALAEPDAHYAADVDSSALAWAAGQRRIHAELSSCPPIDARVLVRPSTAWDTLATAVIGPLLGGGSAVVVDGEASDDELHRIGAAERVTTALA